jgi:hypothetical protein
MERKESMEKQDRKNIVVEFLVRPIAPAKPSMDGLISDEALSVNVLRARITARDAWLKLDVSGTTAAVDRFVRRHGSEGGVVHPVSGRVA